jgi:hypothetical protein
MRTIETTATIREDGTLTVAVPADIGPGDHRIVVVIDDALLAPLPAPLSPLPVREYGPWPTDLALRREDLYDAWGR